jgi:tetratricopeptide (TPR) repeat protein
VAIRPGSASTHTQLGNALHSHGKFDEAIAEHRAAIRLRPDFAGAHGNLGIVLATQGKHDEAIAEHRAAIRLNPDSANHYFNLGMALWAQGKLDEAIAAYRNAIKLKPDYFIAHENLIAAFRTLGKLPEMVAEYREAVRVNPDSSTSHYCLGRVLENGGKLEDAIAQYREAARLKSDFALTTHGVGSVYQIQGKFREAATAFRDALRLDPKLPFTNVLLGQCEEYEGNPEEALAAYRRALELYEPYDPLARELPDMIRVVERQVALAARLGGVLRGEDKPSGAAETLAFAQLCSGRKLYAAAVRFFADAFAVDSKLALDRNAQNRYSAVCAAALASCGKSKDNPPPDEAARPKLRRQALEWLKAELEAWKRELASNDPPVAGRSQLNVAPVRERFQVYVGQYRLDGDLACVREPDALAKLPEEEQKAWHAFWADVDAALKGAAERKP